MQAGQRLNAGDNLPGNCINRRTAVACSERPRRSRVFFTRQYRRQGAMDIRRFLIRIDQRAHTHALQCPGKQKVLELLRQNQHGNTGLQRRDRRPRPVTHT
jgi:hypothetical protein